MKSHGIIYYGEVGAPILDEAYKSAINHMAEGSQISENEIKQFVQNFAYPNFFHLKKKEDKNEISIDDARQMINYLAQKSTLSGKRAVIIEDFENMSHNAANAILKILEEPPLDALIILTTTRFFSILPTIRSRCIKVRVRRNQSLKIGKCETDSAFIETILEGEDVPTLKNFLAFIGSGCRDFIEFSKTNAENFDLFLKVAMLYCAYGSFMKADLICSQKLLKLQEFAQLSKNTYPDKQAGIIEICRALMD